MGPLLRFSLPAFAVGSAVGYLVAGGSSLASRGPSAREQAAESSTTAEEDDARVLGATSDERRLLALCAREAARTCGAAEGAARTAGRSSGLSDRGSARREMRRDESGDRARVEDLFQVVSEAGLWSRGAGFKARHLLRQLPEADGPALRERIDAALKAGDLEIQPGAWLPPAG